MIESFKDWNPHFFVTISLSWFVMKSLAKTYSFNFFLTTLVRDKNVKWKFWFLWKLFSISPLISGFSDIYGEQRCCNTSFWIPCGHKLLVFKRQVYLLMKNVKLFNYVLEINVKFFFLNSLTTKCYKVWNRAFLLHTVTLIRQHI